jgi:hypothetical protein
LPAKPVFAWPGVSLSRHLLGEGFELPEDDEDGAATGDPDAP